MGGRGGRREEGGGSPTSGRSYSWRKVKEDCRPSPCLRPRPLWNLKKTPISRPRPGGLCSFSRGPKEDRQSGNGTIGRKYHVLNPVPSHYSSFVKSLCYSKSCDTSVGPVSSSTQTKSPRQTRVTCTRGDYTTTHYPPRVPVLNHHCIFVLHRRRSGDSTRTVSGSETRDGVGST